jgi:hypothetical protein
MERSGMREAIPGFRFASSGLRIVMRATFFLRRSHLARSFGFDATLSPPGDLSYGV